MEIRRYIRFAPLLLIILLLLSCKGKNQEAEAQYVNNEEFETCTDEDNDTLVYEVLDAPLTEAVDESFLDFFYTFLNRKGFQSERTVYPVDVKDENGLVVEVLKNGRSVRKAVSFPNYEYLVFLLGDDQDPYDYLAGQSDHAEIQKVDLKQGNCYSYAFDRKNSVWMFTGIHAEDGGQRSQFFHFLNEFVTDSIFRYDHLADEIYISLPSDDDEMDTMEGNIDPLQWSVFGTELPQDTMLLLDLGNSAFNDEKVKVVKCGLASSMVEVLTFQKEGDYWKLIKYEE